MEDVHIAAPSLEDFLFHQNPNPASLNISGCKSNLRNLCICHFRVTDVWIQENLSGLRLLENSTFGGFLIDRSIDDTLDNEPKHNKLYFDSLKDLNLSVTYEPLLSSILEIEAPNLDCFTYECDEINAASAPLPLICPNLTDARLLLGTFDRNLDDPMLHKILIDLLRSFGHCKTLSLSLCRDFKISEQERETLSPPLYEVKHLTLSTGVFSSPFIVLWLVDTLLWLVPHPETISFNNTRNIHEVVVKFYYGKSSSKIEEGEDCVSCCSSFPTKCWRHCISEVAWENIDDWLSLKLKNYFVQNATNAVITIT